MSIHIKQEDENSYVSHEASMMETVECNTVVFVAEVPTCKATQMRWCKEHTVEAPVPYCLLIACGLKERSALLFIGDHRLPWTIRLPCTQVHFQPKTKTPPQGTIQCPHLIHSWWHPSDTFFLLQVSSG